MIKRSDLQRLIRENYLELEVTSNSYAFVMYKSNKFGEAIEEHWEEYGEVKYLDIDICKRMTGFFQKKWLVITDFSISTKKMDKEDKELVKQIELKDIYDYLNITRYYTVENGEIILHDLEYFYDLLLNAQLEGFKIALNSMQKTDKQFLWHTAVRLFKENRFSDIKKIQVLEEVFDKIDYFTMG